MEKSDRELLKQVDETRRANPGLEKQLTQYRKDRATYERVVRGREAPSPSASPPAADGGTRAPASRPVAGRGRVV